MLTARLKLKCMIAGGLLAGSIATAHASSFNGVFYLSGAAQYSSYYIDDLKFQGMNPRLAAGYGGMANSMLYLAAELFALPFTATINNNPTLVGSLKTSYSWGASLIPGYFFDDSVMGYVRLSYVATRFENLSTTKSGYEAGLGVDVGWTENWNVFGEYDYAKYRTINNVGGPRAGLYILGLKYKFV